MNADGSGNYAITTTPFTSGSYNLTVRVTDLAGNVNTEVPASSLGAFGTPVVPDATKGGAAPVPQLHTSAELGLVPAMTARTRVAVGR